MPRGTSKIPPKKTISFVSDPKKTKPKKIKKNKSQSNNK